MPIGPGLGAIGAAIVGGGISAFGSAQANKASAAAAQAQMDFQKEAMQHSYQWAMADMKKAGLNPMLAYQRGGASALSGASYQPVNELAGLGAGIQEGVNSAIVVRRQNQELKNMKATVDQTKAATLREKSATSLNKELERKANFDAKASYYNVEHIRAGMAGARASETRSMIDEAFFKSQGGQFARKMELYGNSAASVTRALPNFLRPGPRRGKFR